MAIILFGGHSRKRTCAVKLSAGNQRQSNFQLAPAYSLANLSIRAGLIVGQHDYIDRFSYWVKRVSEGGEVITPASSDRPVQLIDVRDLAEWNIKMIEEGRTSIYNATDPNYKLTFGEFLTTCRAASRGNANFVWVGEEFLSANGVKPWSELPFWFPSE